MGIGVVGVVALIHVLVEVIAIRNGGQPLRGAVRRGPNSSVTRTVATYLVPSA